MWRSFVVLGMAVLTSRSVGAADPPGSQAARDALALCDAPKDAPEAARADSYARGLALAEHAIDADGKDAVAYFAAFCNRGRRMELAGRSIRNVVEVRRLRSDIDHAVALAPDWPDALAGKGRLLLDLPRVLGGDPAEGERLLRRALDLDPHETAARVRLAHALADRGAKDQARTEAERAARDATGDDAADARALAERLK